MADGSWRIDELIEQRDITLVLVWATPVCLLVGITKVDCLDLISIFTQIVFCKISLQDNSIPSYIFFQGPQSRILMFDVEDVFSHLFFKLF